MTDTISAASSPALIDGSRDVENAANELAARLPEQLTVLARIAYNYRWSWLASGDKLFARLDPARWEIVNHNPVRMLHELGAADLQRAANDETLIAESERVLSLIAADLSREPLPTNATAERPVTFMCAEFAIHRSLPIYAGGLGVLAGDILKEASDLALPMVGFSLLYREGYFLQRMDQSGVQHEFWHPVDPEREPAVLVRKENGEPLTVEVPIRGRNVVVAIWRVDVGRVPLYLLDADRPENTRIDKWITARLYVSDRTLRLAQYSLLGIGSMRALRAMGMTPSIIHLNEGHASLAPLEVARQAIAEGTPRHNAFSDARDLTVFTTHTPVEAGNEGYGLDEIASILGDFPQQVGIDEEAFLRFGRTHPENPHEPFVMTPMGIKMSRFANGVSKRHGEIARGMWHSLFPERPVDTVPIGHITNGVHLPSWMAPPMMELLNHYLEPDWLTRANDESVWQAVDTIPDHELWQVRNEMRASFLNFARDRTIANRLARNEPNDYIEGAERGFNENTLTIGFARRLATYKRLYILTMETDRVRNLLENKEHPLQLVLAGKAHPHDEEAKHSARGLFDAKTLDPGGERVSFLDNYDLAIAAQMVSGCDLWINLPRPPLEASGTSGMKSALNGGLNLSVLDGWWAEAFNGDNGWSLPGDIVYDPAVQDTRDAAAFYDCLEHEVAPLFYERDGDGIPHGWIAKIKNSLKTNGPRFSATRMVREYIEEAYSRG
jgi:starch phosphorylase